jgi:predicted MPP superfamily phosphohydrolase
MRLAWLTDIHLNFLNHKARWAFYRTVATQVPDVVLVGGDIGEAPGLAAYLDEMESAFRRPIYFVLGNHDFYGSSISHVKAVAKVAAGRSDLLHYLPHEGLVALGEDTALLGHDSWADGRFGDYEGSNMVLNDHFLIRDFALQDKAGRLKQMQRLARSAAAHFTKHLPQALRRFGRVIVLTHVPPFREACWYQGRTSNDSALPHFACKAVGDVLLGAMRAHPDRRMTVLCGHTHGGGKAEPLPNLTVYTGEAAYYEPAVQRTFEVA